MNSEIINTSVEEYKELVESLHSENYEMMVEIWFQKCFKFLLQFMLRFIFQIPFQILLKFQVIKYVS